MDGRRCAAVFQEDRLCGHMTAASNVRLGLDRSNWARVEGDLRLVGLEGEALTKPVRELSGGQRRRVAIVRAMATDADLLVLDEPFTGLDADAKPAIMTYVRERLAGRTVLLITHDPAEAKSFDARVLRLPNRR
jgi:NitT/TauT family transport system ATP-binding protein